MSVLTFGGVASRPVRRVVARPVAPAPVMTPLWAVLGIPSWAAPQCQGDPLFPALASYTQQQVMVCLMASPMPMRVSASAVTLDDAAWWALEGLRSLGGAKVRRLALAEQEASDPFVLRLSRTTVAPGFFREWAKARAEATEGVVSGSVRYDSANDLADYLVFRGFQHGEERCFYRGLCRHCYPQNFASRDETPAAARYETRAAATAGVAA